MLMLTFLVIVVLPFVMIGAIIWLAFYLDQLISQAQIERYARERAQELRAEQHRMNREATRLLFELLDDRPWRG